jgi:hypothetical protein
LKKATPDSMPSTASAIRCSRSTSSNLTLCRHVGAGSFSRAFGMLHGLIGCNITAQLSDRWCATPVKHLALVHDQFVWRAERTVQLGHRSADPVRNGTAARW